MLRLMALAAVLGAVLPAGAQERAAWMQQARWGVMTHYVADWMARAHNINIEEWNKLVDGFDVETLAGQLASVGTRYYLITIGQNSRR